MSNRPGIVAEDKDLAKVERVAREQGWDVRLSGGGHMKWFAPDGETIIVTSMTPGSSSGLRKATADLVKAGLRLEDTKMSRRTKARPVAVGTPYPIPGQNLDRALIRAIEVAVDEAERQTSIIRAKYILEMGGATDAELSEAYRLLPGRQQQAALRLILADDPPTKTCPCGRTFQSYIPAELHREKCDVALGKVPIEPETAPVPEDLVGVRHAVEIDLSDGPEHAETAAPTTLPDPVAGPESAVKALSHQPDTMPTAVPAAQPDTNSEELPMGAAVQSILADGRFECPIKGCDRFFDTHRGMTRHVTMTHRSMRVSGGTVIVQQGLPTQIIPNDLTAPEVVAAEQAPDASEEHLDALLQIVTDGRPIPFSLATMRIVNEWIESTRKLLALVAESDG